MSNHGLATLFIVLFVIVPLTMVIRIAPQIDCEKMIDVTEENCKLWSEQVGQISFVFLIVSITICLIIAVQYFSSRDKVEETKYYRQAIGNHNIMNGSES